MLMLFADVDGDDSAKLEQAGVTSDVRAPR